MSWTRRLETVGRGGQCPYETGRLRRQFLLSSGALLGALLRFVIFLHVLSLDTLTHGKVLGPLMAAHQMVISALMGVLLHPFPSQAARFHGAG